MTKEKFEFGISVVENKVTGLALYRKFKHIYTLEPGDKWCWLGDEIVVANVDKIPFTINIVTGERKNIEVELDTYGGAA